MNYDDYIDAIYGDEMDEVEQPELCAACGRCTVWGAVITAEAVYCSRKCEESHDALKQEVA